MRCMVLHRPGPPTDGPLRPEARPDPLPGPGMLLARVLACAVCRTDLQLVEGDLAARRLPIVPGHQVVGEVMAAGPDCPGWAPGDRVGAHWLSSSCGTCARCRRGAENLCGAARFTGWDVDGGYADRMLIPASTAARVPAGPDPVELAPLLCGGVIGHRALRMTGAGRGDRLGLFGFGASARLTIQEARAAGMRVFVCTRSESERRAAAALGAEWAGDFDEAPPEALDAAITTAPVGDVIPLALRALDRGGVVVVNAIHLDRVPEFPYELLWWERTLRSVANVTRADAEEFLAAAASIPVQTAVRRFPLDEANTALDLLARGELDATAVLVP